MLLSVTVGRPKNRRPRIVYFWNWKNNGLTYLTKSLIFICICLLALFKKLLSCRKLVICKNLFHYHFLGFIVHFTKIVTSFLLHVLGSQIHHVMLDCALSFVSVLIQNMIIILPFLMLNKFLIFFTLDASKYTGKQIDAVYSTLHSVHQA